MLRRTPVLLLAAAGLTSAGLAAAAVPAGAAGAGCPVGASCVYSGPDQGGTVAVLPGGFGCRTAASLGLPSVRSAVNNVAEQTILLYADANCRTAASPGFVTREVDDVNPPALSVRIRPLP
jgi:Peptidase inhibitor family I36